MELDFLNLAIYLLILLAIGLFGVVMFAMLTSHPPNLTRHDSEKYFVVPGQDKKILFPNIDETATIDLSIIVPAYNEEDRLHLMMDETMEYLGEREKREPSFTYEIIIVDDGSRDKTSQKALSYSEEYGTDKVRVLTFEQNRGKGGAVRMGMLSSRGKRLLFADADGATRFSDIGKVEAKLQEINTNQDGMAVVCGSRAHLEQDSIAERTIFRTFLMFGFHFLVWFLCVRGIRDTQCGFKLLTREAARLLFYNLHVERWAFDVDLLHIAQHFHIPVAEVPVTWHEVEGSKLSPLWASLQMFRDLFLIRLRYLIGAWKMEDKPKRQ